MKLRHWEEPNDPINQEHLRLGLPPVEAEVIEAGHHPVLRLFAWLAGFMLLFASGYLLSVLHQQYPAWENWWGVVSQTLQNSTFWQAVGVGLLAQTVDGALGMAYGITSTSFLMMVGHSPLVASASVHVAEVFTTGASGLSHLKMKNVDRALFLRLLIPGISGAVLGVWLLSKVNGALIKPIIAGYLILMGLYVIHKAFRKKPILHHPPRHVAKLALLGGWLDSTGGGGWGPVVTTHLLAAGASPRTTIGSVNFAEFFLTFITAFAFIFFVDNEPWMVIFGLVIGGVFAAPFASLLTRALPTKSLLIIVGSLISVVSSFNLYQSFFK